MKHDPDCYYYEHPERWQENGIQPVCTCEWREATIIPSPTQVCPECKKTHCNEIKGERNRLTEMARQEGRAEERQFTLNILNGIDIADEQMQNKGGGTRAIRAALASRII